MDRRRVLALAAIPATIAPWMKTFAGPEANEGLLPLPRDLKRESRDATGRSRLCLVLFSLPDCVYCGPIRRQQLEPVGRDARLRDRVLVREVSITGSRTFHDFAGALVTESRFAAVHEARVSPTVAFLGPDATALEAPIIGSRIPDFYGAYLEDGIQSALRKLEARA